MIHYTGQAKFVRKRDILTWPALNLTINLMISLFMHCISSVELLLGYNMYQFMPAI